MTKWEEKIGQWRWTVDVKRDTGTGMCNTTESAWAMWAKLSAGWLLGEEGCSEGTCHLRCLQLLSAVPENISSSPGTSPCPHDPARPRLTLDYQAVAALPHIWLCLRPHGSPCWISPCVGTGPGFDWSVPSALFWSCHRDRISCHHSVCG